MPYLSDRIAHSTPRSKHLFMNRCVLLDVYSLSGVTLLCECFNVSSLVAEQCVMYILIEVFVIEQLSFQQASQESVIVSLTSPSEMQTILVQDVAHPVYTHSERFDTDIILTPQGCTDVVVPSTIST